MNKLCIVVLVGLPASGKSTEALRICQHFNGNCINIRYDDFLVVQSNKNLDFKGFRERMLQLVDRLIFNLKNCSVDMIEDFFKVNHLARPIHIHRNKNFVIIIDDNNYYCSMRHEMYKIAQKNEIGFLQIFFKITLENSLKANSKRHLDKCVPVDVITRMSLRLEPPNTKNHWEKHFMEIDGGSIDLNRLEIMVGDRVINFEEIKHETKVESPTNSIIHEIDLILRKRITNLMKSISNDFRKMYAEELNAKRKSLLDNLRNNIVNIPTDLNEINDLI